MAFAGIADCFTCSCGHTRTTANFAKATFEALKATYGVSARKAKEAER